MITREAEPYNEDAEEALGQAREARERGLTHCLAHEGAELARISPQAIAARRGDIALLQQMVKEVLVRGVDYGRIPGTPQDSLWDPGAQQINSHFNVYAGERRIIRLEDSPERISVVIEVPLISRETGRVVAAGVGAASTLETKYKYRWVSDPAEWGYEGSSVKALKTKELDKGQLLYRIPNPEHGELLNTIIKMSSKRAEVDAVQALPGVASALRALFQGQGQMRKEARPGPQWTQFWGEVRRFGYTDHEAHAQLGVASMQDWLAQGHTLEEALEKLRGKGEGKHA